MHEQELCQFDFTDRNQCVIACRVHGEREVLKPTTREAVLNELLKAGKWAGPNPSCSETAPVVPSASLPTPVSSSYDVVEYHTPDGQTVSLSATLFRNMICPEANINQSHYMLLWCAHNGIDPFAHEAHFMVVAGRPVIMVSKDAWFRRMERHPSFVSHDSGLIVEAALQTIKEALVGGFDHYLISDVLRQKLLTDFAAGNVSEPTGIAARLTVRKRGQYVGQDTLLGGWAEIQRSDRPHPYLFQIDKKGWETRKREGGESHF